MVGTDNAIFLLGGHDLEMMAIRELLEECHLQYFDKNLTWGAKLSDYTQEIENNKDKIFYAVELLIDDLSLVDRYSIKIIDHHNEYSDRKASLLQILDILNLPPTREQELIAANDENHIEGMRCIGASEEEIANIRKNDRAIQGVTAEEEAQALMEIEYIEKKGDVYLLHTSLSRFSPIVDNFEKRPLLLYSDTSLSYYGDIAFLKKHYKKQIENNEAYHGRGFFGFDSSYIDSTTSTELAKEILTVKKEKNIISYHNFMFPFRFDKIVKPIKDKHEFYRECDFDKRVDINKDFKEKLEKDHWEYQKFEVKNNLDYNEIVYFHDFVKDALFNTQDFDKAATSYYFEKKIDDDVFELKVKGQEPYLLRLEGVNLRLFDTGVGILSFEVENYRYENIEDILKINDYGRRVYPQFLGEGFSVEKTQKAFLPEYIKVNGIEECFNETSQEIKLAKYIEKVFGTQTFTTQSKEINKYFIQPIIDDRMFILCWYGNDDFSSCIQKNIESENWYKYVFVDGNAITVQDKQMHKSLIEKATYKRWKDYGTFFGITRYSFVCSSASLQTLKEYDADFIIDHMKTMYFQMVTLLLVQRASLLRFSDEITAISDVRGKESPSTKNISILYKNYLRFVNKLYFKEVTPQDQGIELYDRAIDILNIKRDIEDLRQEIGSLNGYAFLEQEREEKEQMNKLTKLGTIFLPGTFIAGVFGMNVFPEHFIDNVCGLGLAFGSIIGLTYYLTKIHDISIKEFFKRRKGE